MNRRLNVRREAKPIGRALKPIDPLAERAFDCLSGVVGLSPIVRWALRGMSNSSPTESPPPPPPLSPLVRNRDSSQWGSKSWFR